MAPEQGRRVWVQRSRDLGSSWTDPVEITAAVSRPDWRWYATGPTSGLALAGGRIVVPADRSEPSGAAGRSTAATRSSATTTGTPGGWASSPVPPRHAAERVGGDRAPGGPAAVRQPQRGGRWRRTPGWWRRRPTAAETLDRLFAPRADLAGTEAAGVGDLAPRLRPAGHGGRARTGATGSRAAGEPQRGSTVAPGRRGVARTAATAT